MTSSAKPSYAEPFGATPELAPGAYPATVVGAPPLSGPMIPPSAGGPYSAPSLADVVTLASYGLGLWWAAGGPAWAAVASIVGDELDGHLARTRGTESVRGSHLDWGADIALTSASLLRLGTTIGNPTAAIVMAPPVLLAQAALRSDGIAPRVGSARAAIMLAAIVAKHRGWKL